MRVAAVTALQVATRRADKLVSAGTGNHPIPPITDPMGQYWDQPKRADITVDDYSALMTVATFKQLAEYAASTPTGVYPGKMWRRHITQGGRDEWLLCWYGPCIKPECPDCDKFCSNHYRKIILVDTQ